MVMANKNFNATIKLMVLLDTEGGGGDGQQGTSGLAVIYGKQK